MIAVWFSAVVAFCAILLGALVVVRAPRHPAHLSFGIGMLMMALEVVLSGIGGREHLTESALIRIARFRLLAVTLFPAPWIIFSLCYSRGDSRDVLQRWKPWLILLALAPPAFGVAFWNSLAGPALIPAFVAPLATLGWAGSAVEVVGLLAGVLVLTNLERTFRHVIGIMRWRTKYVFLAVGALAGFRIYASS